MEIQQKTDSELSYEDFDSFRCDKCKQYLNCPNIMVYADPKGEGKPYTECGRCFNESAPKKNLPTPFRNRSAEILAAVTPFPCKHYIHGCRERRIWPNIQVHEEECMYRILECISVKEGSSEKLAVLEAIQKYSVEYSNLVIHDGVILFTFDKNMDQLFLIHQNSDFFLCKIKYDLDTDTLKFTVALFETRKNTKCSIEFSSTNLQHVVTLRIDPNSEETLVDLKAIRTLLGNNSIQIKCKVYLNMRLFPLPSDELLKEVQCPSCWDYMMGRILLCSRGHSVCLNCSKNLTNCAVCREGEVTEIRNFSLEKVISEAFFPCKNHNEGCSYVSTLDQIDCHQAYCRFNLDNESVLKTLAV